MRLPIVVAVLMLLGASTSMAATISGSVYGPDLDLVPDAVVRIDTLPAQQYVAKNGSYLFHVPSGTYVIAAEFRGTAHERYAFSEQVIVRDDGSYTLDLLLLPSAAEEITPYPEQNLDVEAIDLLPGRNMISSAAAAVLLILGIILMCTGLFLRFRPRRQVKSPGQEDLIPADDDLETVMAIVASEKRISQKEIVRQMPLSEAKISLILTDLESQGRIRKVKKGRANIIILNTERKN